MKKIRIDKFVILQCKMIEGGKGAGRVGYPDYAALSFLRKTKDDNAFEFNLPLKVAFNLIDALNLIIKDNPKYFQKYKQ